MGRFVVEKPEKGSNGSRSFCAEFHRPRKDSVEMHLNVLVKSAPFWWSARIMWAICILMTYSVLVELTPA